MTDKELMQQALIKAARFAIKALDEEAAAYGPKDRIAHVDEAAAMLRAALAQPVVAPEWVGLTDEEVDQAHHYMGGTWSTTQLVRHIEAKLKEKNT